MLHAFYGSLRKGMYNNVMLGDSVHMGTETLKGFKMWSYGSYPQAQREEGYKIVVDLYEITKPNIIADIHGMEKGAGYDVVYVDTSKGKAVMYVVNKPMNEHIEDWVKHWNETVEATSKALDEYDASSELLEEENDN